MEKEAGLSEALERPLLARLLFHIIGSLYTQAHTHSRAQQTKSGCDISAGRKAKQLLLSLLYCLWCREKLETLGLLLAGSKGDNLEVEGDPTAGSVLHRELKVKECSA